MQVAGADGPSASGAPPALSGDSPKTPSPAASPLRSVASPTVGEVSGPGNAFENGSTPNAKRGIKIMPDILAVGGGGTLKGVGATLMKFPTDRLEVPATPNSDKPSASDGEEPAGKTQ